MSIPIGGARQTPSDYANTVQKKVNDLVNNTQVSGTNKITQNELAEITSTALQDDGKITDDELKVINDALKTSNNGTELTSLDFKNSNTFSFQLKKPDGKVSTSEGKIDASADVTSTAKINLKDQAYIKSKTGLDIGMSGWVKNSSEIQQVVDGLIKSNGFNPDAYKSNTNGYAERMKGALKDLMQGADDTFVQKFCDTMFGVIPMTYDANKSMSPEIKTLQEGLVKMGMTDLLSQDGSKSTDGKLGLRTSTAIDRMFYTVKAAMEIPIPKNTTVIAFTDNSGSMVKHSDAVANSVDKMKEVANLKGSTFTLVEGYNHKGADERVVQTALNFLKTGSFVDNNGATVKSPVDIAGRNKESQPMQLFFQTDSNLDPMNKAELQELINMCFDKKINIVIKNPSTGTQISMYEIANKICNYATDENKKIVSATIDSKKFAEVYQDGRIDYNKVKPGFGEEGK